MSVNKQKVSNLFSILAHPLRREILIRIKESGELSFTDLMNDLDINTGKLSFHLRNLRDLLEATSNSKYRLTNLGKHALTLIQDVETLSGEINPKQTTSVFPIADLKRRTYAFLIDSFLVFAAFVIVGVITNLVAVLTSGGIFRLDFNILVFLLFLWIYSTLLEGFSGQTLGKKILGLKVIPIDTLPRVSWEQVAVRNFGKCFLLPFDLLSGSKLKDNKYKRYFDKFAGTIVVDISNKQNN